ncbi:MAG TPA: fused MFS/spermidine synthase [Dehalococcoidia bacterium]|nr:fused MFS/spermidine synthase [Dehalococcoidia bacterium]
MAWKTFTKRQGEEISYQVLKELLVTRTPHQRLEILDTVPFGRCLFLDDKIQSSEADEFIYHESMAHPALVAHPSPRRVLIVGSGEGALLRETLRHSTVERVLMVDIDEEVVRACREHLGPWHQGAFGDSRVQLLHGDARAHLEESPEVFDAILVDVTDPLAGGPSYRIFTREFYQLAGSRLSPGGAIAVQAESTDLGVHHGHLSIVQTLKSVFPYVAPYRVHVPSFGESWGFALASKVREAVSLTPSQVDETLARRGCAGLRFYDGEAHSLLFAQPRYLRLARPAPIISDSQPLFIG